MSTRLDQPTLSPALVELLAKHREEAQRLREQYGDPMEHLAAVARASFDPESFHEVFQEYMAGTLDRDDDEPDGR